MVASWRHTHRHRNPAGFAAMLQALQDVSPDLVDGVATLRRELAVCTLLPCIFVHNRSLIHVFSCFDFTVFRDTALVFSICV
jgi:hypothetical protein